MNPLIAKETKVLIVDDQVLAKGYMKYSLEELGFSDITYVDKVNLALNKIRHQRYDLIVCSYNLKHEQDGYYFYDEINRNGELPPSTAFVFISADTTADLVQSIVELQPDDFLAKPFTVKELDRRLTRILSRKRALQNIYWCIEKKQFPKALSEVEILLSEPKNSEFFPLALKIKGEILQACGQYSQAKVFYQAILNVQKFTWAQLGLVKTHLFLNEDEAAEKLVLRLAFKPESQLAAYDLLMSLQIKQGDFDTALECVLMASEISPRNIRRHKTALDLSRITHDYHIQFEAAKKIVKFAKNSIHDMPEHYLNVARAGIDYAMTADEEQTAALVKQANEYIRQLRQAFPKADMQDQINVINARMLYLADEKDNAKSLLEQLDDENWENESIEALLDKAKAFHEIGLHARSQEMLLEIARRCDENDQSSGIFLHYIEQEKVEKGRIKLSSKELNNSGVQRFQEGDIDSAFHTFVDAFTLMPKNSAIALNLLQVLTIKQLHCDEAYKNTIQRCVKTVESGVLNDEQENRYTKIRELLDDIA
tara:strand:+ start:330 stop:1946 length:1617 start_codon:yes stop_codon:yes gene_type:complete